MFRLRTPRYDEAAILTELCLRSKAAWGYDEEFMQACRAELTLTASIMRSSCLKVAEIGGHIVGVAQVTVNGELAELDKLFVEPTRLRSGAGKALFDWATTVARDGGVLFLTLALSALSLVSGAVADSRGPLPHDGAVDRGCELARHVRLYRGRHR